MAGNDEEMNKPDDLFQGSDADDMADFMSMLDKIDEEGASLAEELNKVVQTDTEDDFEDISDDSEEEELNSISESEELLNMAQEEPEMDMISELGLSGINSLEEPQLEKVDSLEQEKTPQPENDEPDVESARSQPDAEGEESIEDVTSFVPTEEDNILDLLDSVGDESNLPGDDKEAEDIAEESVGELADIFASFEGEMTEPEVDMQTVVKKGFFKRLAERFKKSPTEEELLQKEMEEEEERQWEEQQAAAAQEKKEEARAKKAEKQAEAAARKQAQNEKKAAAKAAKEEQKAAKLAEKEEARGPIPKSQFVPVKPVVAVVVVAVAIGVAGVLFTNYRFYNTSISQAKEQFIHQKYNKAYELLAGLDIKKKDEKFYDQVRTIRIVDKNLDAYNNYIDAENYEMALDALVQGIGKYNVQEEKAKELNLDKEMYALYEKMIGELTARFRMTVRDAQNLYELKDRNDYEKQIVQFARNAAIKDGVLEPVNVTSLEQ